MNFACIISYSGGECGSVLRLGGGEKTTIAVRFGVCLLFQKLMRGEKKLSPDDQDCIHVFAFTP